MKHERWQSVAFWFLFLSYAIGSPAFAILEIRTGLISGRFDYSPAFICAVAAAQFASAFVLLSRSFAIWGLAVLTVLALGAVYSHFRIDSPLTSIPAIIYVAVQVWYGLRVQRDRPAN